MAGVAHLPPAALPVDIALKTRPELKGAEKQPSIM